MRPLWFQRHDSDLNLYQCCINTVVVLSADGMQGLKRFDARQRVETILRESGLYRGEVEHDMLLPVCRSVVAPLICSVVNFLCQICTIVMMF